MDLPDWNKGDLGFLRKSPPTQRKAKADLFGLHCYGGHLKRGSEIAINCKRCRSRSRPLPGDLKYATTQSANLASTPPPFPKVSTAFRSEGLLRHTHRTGAYRFTASLHGCHRLIIHANFEGHIYYYLAHQQSFAEWEEGGEERKKYMKGGKYVKGVQGWGGRGREGVLS